MAVYFAFILVALIAFSAKSSAQMNNASADFQMMVQHKLIPDVIQKPPQAVATITYGNVTVDMGSEVTPTQVNNKPNVTWSVENDSYYTLVMTDVDVPPERGAKEMQMQHWLVVNIPNNDIEKGEAIFDYMGSAPAEGTGFHRYIFLVYRQDKIMEKEQYGDIEDVQYDIRQSYLLKDLIKKFNFKDPVAANFLLAQYDENVPEYHNERIKQYNRFKLDEY